MEGDLKAGGDFVDVRDAASKSADNAAQLAGLFHALDAGAAGQVDGDTMERGYKLAGWYLGEARRVLAGVSCRPAMRTRSRSTNACRARLGGDFTASTAVLQFGPRALRKAAVRDAVLAVLV